MFKYEKFKQTIQRTIQGSGLDVGIVYFILKDIVHEIEPLYYQQVEKEAQSEKENAQEEQSE